MLQVWLSWGSLLCVTGAGLAQFVHLCVLQVWLDWGVTSVCYRRRAGSIGSLVCVTGSAQLGSLRCVTGAGWLN